jgi:S1-C subfamily serine protease
MSRHSISRSPSLRALRCFFLALVASIACADPGGDPIGTQVRGVFEKTKDAVVRIEATDEHGKLSGTGFFIDPNGTLFTSFTIGGESRDIVVCHGATKYPATRLIADSRSGIAILKVEAQTPFLPLGKAAGLSVGSMVVSVGYPMDLPATPSFGVVGGFDLKYLGRYFCTAHIRANVPAQRGEGGAPLLNMNGEVVGVLISSLDHGPGCFALPVEAAEKVRRDFMHYGEVRPGWMGISVGEAKNPAAGSVAEVQDFMDGAPAEKSGLKRGDILVQVGEHPVKTPEDVLNAAYYLTAGNEVPLTVLRDGASVEVKIQAGEHPSMPRKTAQIPLMPGIPLRMGR